MSGTVPEGEVDDGLVDLDGGGGVVEDGGHVLGGELVLGVAGCGQQYVVRMQVLPTTPSPTITSLIGMAYGSIDFYIIHFQHLYLTINRPRILSWTADGGLL